MIGDDTLLPAAPVLLGEEARQALAAAVEFAGGRLKGLVVRQVQYQPGRSLAVLYDAKLAWPGKPVTTEGLVAMTSVDGPPAGSLPVEAEGLQIGVWRLAHDPLLPGLAVALSKSGARRLLTQERGPVAMSLRTYRPTRRAVVRLTGTTTRYAKVVRPSSAAALRACHERFLDAGLPAPAVVAMDEEHGIVCLAELPGRPMVDALAAGDALPDGAELLALLDRIAAVDLVGAPRPRLSNREDARAQARLLRTVLPEAAARIDAVVAGLGDDPADDRVRTVHGDFYEAQLLVDDGRVSGVLDLDRAGRGALADDLGTMLGHLTALGVHRPTLAPAASDYLRRLWRDFAAATDPADLRCRAAATVLGLATGPFRLQQPDWQRETGRYLASAEAWLEGTAVDPDTQPLMGGTR